MAALEQKLTRLDRKVARLIRNVDSRFREVDTRFREVDARFREVDARFEQVDERFREVWQEIREEGERTRRHFDVVAESFRSQIVVALDANRATDERLTQFSADVRAFGEWVEGILHNHEARLQDVEKLTREP